jgi:dienelactone hydrolase
MLEAVCSLDVLRAACVSACVALMPQAAGLADDARFSAEDVIRGVTTTRDRCEQPGRIWVEHEGESECLRFYGASAGSPGRTPLLFLEGDVLRQAQPGTEPPTWEVVRSYRRLSPALMQAEAERYASAAARPFVNLARPGTYGSSGRHLERRREREVALVNQAVDRLKQRFGWTRINLAGLSGGGHLVAALMARRDDVGCAVIASGNVAVRERLRERGRTTDMTGYADSVDPLDLVSDVARHPPRTVIVLTDPADRLVSAASQGVYVAALRAAGVEVDQRFVQARDPDHHLLRTPAIMAGLACGFDP